jgi:hypothetical protein
VRGWLREGRWRGGVCSCRVSGWVECVVLLAVEVGTVSEAERRVWALLCGGLLGLI